VRPRGANTGFARIGSLLASKLPASVRQKMLGVGLPAVLNDIDDEGKLRLGSALKPTPSLTTR
jgi:hypothetical protein